MNAEVFMKVVYAAILLFNWFAIGGQLNGRRYGDAAQTGFVILWLMLNHPF